jgi:cytochrome b561
MSAAHVFLFKVLLGLVSIHVAATIWHVLIIRDATLARMLTTQSPSREDGTDGRQIQRPTLPL